MLQFIVSIIAFVATTFVGGFLGGFMGEELVIAGLLGVILVNLFLSASMIGDLKKEITELKNILRKDEAKTEEKEEEEKENKTEDK